MPRTARDSQGNVCFHVMSRGKRGSADTRDGWLIVGWRKVAGKK